MPADAIISIHAPAWGATFAFSSGVGSHSPFQFTPPRGGRRAMSNITVDFGGISIHAPAWGATGATLPPLTGSEISIHAPAWGATRWGYAD